MHLRDSARLWRVLVASFAALVMAFITAQPALAQTTNADAGLNLTTSGSPISLTAKPGQSVSTDLKVKNGGAKTERLKITLLKFSAADERGAPKLEDPTDSDDYIKWVRFSETTFDVVPNEWKTIKMTVTPTAAAAFSYYYAVSFSRASEPQAPTGQEKSVLVGSTAMLVLLKIDKPGANAKLEGRAFSVNKQFYEYLPVTFSVRLHNAGNVYTVPFGNIFVLQGKKQIAALKVNEEQGNILPNSDRIFSAVWADGFPVYKNVEKDGKDVKDTKGQPLRKLHWDVTQIGKLRMGKYTAKLVMVFKDSEGRDVPVNSEVSFWVFPWKLLLITLLILIFTGIGAYVTFRKVYQKSRRRKG